MYTHEPVHEPVHDLQMGTIVSPKEALWEKTERSETHGNIDALRSLQSGGTK